MPQALVPVALPGTGQIASIPINMTTRLSVSRGGQDRTVELLYFSPAADEFVGQQHFLGEGRLLWRLLKSDRLGSVIFYGPPGTGKTTLAHLLAGATRSTFRQLSAVASGDLTRATALLGTRMPTVFCLRTRSFGTSRVALRTKV